MNIKYLFVLAITVATTTTVLAGPVEDQIKIRQSAYEFMGWNAKKIKAQVVDHPETYNKEDIQAAANAIAATANSGLGSLYGEGTDKGIGWQKSHLKPEFFKDQDKAKEIGLSLNKEATKLAEVAATGDVAAIKAQFGEVGKTCKSCHDSFRIRDK
ncbi:MAG: cytochrome c [Methylococcales bacterium]|nr:cytochrome c [Methylococcales bacterium]MDP3838288.1 cytochrome c [Methylococcales bacterium]